MLYNNIIVDVFCLFHIKTDKRMNAQEAAAECILEINGMRSHLSRGGSMHLLFDPIPKDDLSLSASFKNNPLRSAALPSYKANRAHSITVCKAVSYIYKYFEHRGKGTYLYVSSAFEADDYVESIIASAPDETYALVTKDGDWARYLSEKTVIINHVKNWEFPYTAEKYRSDFGYYPTVASVIMTKALFGDKSDCIPGALKTKGLKFYSGAVNDCVKKYISDLSESKDSIDAVVKRLSGYKFEGLNALESRNSEEELVFQIMIARSPDDIMTAVLRNIKAIRCLCRDASEYRVCREPDAEKNHSVEVMLGLTKPEKTSGFVFGGLKNSKR